MILASSKIAYRANAAWPLDKTKISFFVKLIFEVFGNNI
jgi:hypothetical protein